MRRWILLQVFPRDGVEAALPHHALELPHGRFMYGEFEIDFTPSQVLNAMESILEWWDEGMNLPGDTFFPSQASVLAFAEKHLGFGRRAQDREFYAP